MGMFDSEPMTDEQVARIRRASDQGYLDHFRKLLPWLEQCPNPAMQFIIDVGTLRMLVSSAIDSLQRSLDADL